MPLGVSLSPGLANSLGDLGSLDLGGAVAGAFASSDNIALPSKAVVANARARVQSRAYSYRSARASPPRGAASRRLPKV